LKQFASIRLLEFMRPVKVHGNLCRLFVGQRRKRNDLEDQPAYLKSSGVHAVRYFHAKPRFKRPTTSRRAAMILKGLFSKFAADLRSDERQRCLRKIIETEPETILKTRAMEPGKNIQIWRLRELERILAS
jgi:hypothetical protein